MMQTQLVGTMQKNWTGFPKSLYDVKAFERHQQHGSLSAMSVTIQLSFFIQWLDTRTVTLLSTLHRATEYVQVQMRIKVGGELQNANF